MYNHTTHHHLLPDVQGMHKHDSQVTQAHVHTITLQTVVSSQAYKGCTNMITSLSHKSVGVTQGLKDQIQEILSYVVIKGSAAPFNH